MKQKRLIISGLAGGSGKTLTSLALSRIFLNMGQKVLPFKKGPDYIDAAWLSLAAKRNAYNLDPFFLEADKLKQHFYSICAKEEDSLALVEGNRGLYDGKDVQGSASTAELAALLDLPIILTVNAQKCTRTLAAIINGIVDFDKRLSYLGIVVNNVASQRHEKIIYDCVKNYCKPQILGFIPRLSENPIKERHLGLSLDIENKENEEILVNIANIVKEQIDVHSILEKVTAFAEVKEEIALYPTETINKNKINIGYVKDKALWFYYTENLEALEKAGANLIKLSLFSEENWDKVDALYIGGGYPELYAKEISESSILPKIKAFADEGMPIYAECGGFMLLTKSIASLENEKYSMANIFDLDLAFYSKPQGLGYVEAKVTEENPYFEKNTSILGHEFHYTLAKEYKLDSLFKLSKGTGMGAGQDGLLYKNTFACYTHLYALANEEWAKNFVNNALEFKKLSQ